MYRIPRSLTLAGRPLVLAGPGRIRESWAYFSPQTGAVVDLQVLVIVEEHAEYVLGRPKCPGGFVRIDRRIVNGHGARLGDLFLAGPVTYSPQGARASGAWLLEAVRPAPAAGRWRRGVVLSVGPRGFCFVVPVDAGPGRRQAFLHVSQLDTGLLPPVGSAVRYLEVLGPKGLVAMHASVA